MWGVVSSTETWPLMGLQLGGDIWDKKDQLAKVILSKSAKSELVIKIAGTMILKEAWTFLKTEYSQTESDSLILWFWQLTRQLSPGGDVLAHVSGFQEAIHHLTNSDFQIPSYIATAILLSVLPSDPNNSVSWNNHASGVKFDKSFTTLSSVIARILEETCHLTKDNWAALQKQQSMFTALEHKACTSKKKFCRNCMWDSHCSHDCYDPGGVKEDERPYKGNVQLKEHIMTTDFSNYTTSTKCPAGFHFTPQLVEDSAYSTHKSLSSPTAIIDSSTSTYIHSNHNDFLSLDSSTSCNIRGFGGAKSHITGCGTALIAVWLPSGHKTCLKLNKACLVPNSLPTLLSISHMDQAKFYTLFGDRRCVSFPMDDGGQLMWLALTKSNISCMGTQRTHWLYHLDMPNKSPWEYAFLTIHSPMSKFKQLHLALRHLNYPLIILTFCKGINLGGEYHSSSMWCLHERQGNSHFVSSFWEQTSQICFRPYTQWSMGTFTCYIYRQDSLCAYTYWW